MLTKADLDRAFDNSSMKKRTYRFAILSMSLASLFDVSQPNDLLNGLLNTLNEYEQNREEGDRQRLVRQVSTAQELAYNSGVCSEYGSVPENDKRGQ